MTAKISSYLQQMSDYVYFLRLSPFPSGGIQIKTVSPNRPQCYTQINNSYSLLEQSAIERSILIAQNVLVRFRSGSENGQNSSNANALIVFWYCCYGNSHKSRVR